jgi:predicted O-linked N-acetylglucosamine transferase (SPINDLY family)
MATLSEALAIAAAHHRDGRLEVAQDIYRRILEADPGCVDALHLAGVAADQLGQHEAAAGLLRRAIGLKPDVAALHTNLGEACRKMGRINEAIESCQRAIQLTPDAPEAHNALGLALHARRQFDQALACYRRALELRPAFVEAENNLGNLLRDLGQLDEAVAAYQRALTERPLFPQALNNLGVAFKERGQPEQAASVLQHALTLAPEYVEAHNNLGMALRDQGRLDEALDAFHTAVQLDPQRPQPHSNLVYSLLFHPASDARTIHEAHAAWNQQHAEPLAVSIVKHENDRTPQRRLRVGYIAPHAGGPVVGVNLLPLFRHHDHRQFEIYCYADVPNPDAISPEFQRLADVWRPTAGMRDEQLAAEVRADRIDILVDLTLHMGGNRLLTFARKPAPVQVTFAGYPGTTGLSAVDYRLTDAQLDPPGMDDAYYAEESIRLPHSFWCYTAPHSDPPLGELPAAERGYVTFGNLGNFCKINEEVLKLWSRVLRAVPESQLLLRAPEGSPQQRVWQLLAAERISPERVEFVSHQPHAAYLQTYDRIDVGLDTLPYNGHSTSLDALWMGVPVVTLVGRTVVGRAGASQLTNLGLRELIAHTPERFVEIAAGLAGDLDRLAELRRTLRERMRTSPLMDAAGFAQGIEAAYRAMWRRWCEK